MPKHYVSLVGGLGNQLFQYANARANNPKEKFTSGFPKIDNALAGGGLQRGEIYSWIGLPGKGKSLALVKAAVENVKNNKNLIFGVIRRSHP